MYRFLIFNQLFNYYFIFTVKIIVYFLVYNFKKNYFISFNKTKINLECIKKQVVLEIMYNFILPNITLKNISVILDYKV